MSKFRYSLPSKLKFISQDSQQSVSCSLFQDCNTVITSGTRDGAIKLWDIRKIKQTRKISGNHFNSTLVTVSFNLSIPAKNQLQPVETLEYAGNSLRRRGYTCLTLDSTNTLLYASCTDDSIYQYHLMPACNDGKRFGRRHAILSLRYYFGFCSMQRADLQIPRARELVILYRDRVELRRSVFVERILRQQSLYLECKFFDACNSSLLVY